MKKYDLAIVGGSFSGLACANSASVRGLNTVVFDKKKAAESSTQSTGIFVKEIHNPILSCLEIWPLRSVLLDCF